MLLFIVVVTFLVVLSSILPSRVGKPSRPRHASPVDTTCLVRHGVDPTIFAGLDSIVQNLDLRFPPDSEPIKDEMLAKQFVKSVLSKANASKSHEYFLTELLESAGMYLNDDAFPNGLFVRARCLVHEKNTHTTLRIDLVGVLDTQKMDAILIGIEPVVCAM